jgi:hypothetical protein
MLPAPLQEYLGQLPVPRLGPLASDALTLALPSFQAPPDMVGWERARRARRAAAAQVAESIRQHRQRIKQMVPLVSGGGAQGSAAGRLANVSSLSSALPPLGPPAGTAGAGPAALGGSGGECGAVRAHLLVEYHDDYEDDAPADSSAPADGPGAAQPTAGSAGQRRPSGSTSRGSGGEDAALRLSLVISSCTARGTVKQARLVLVLRLAAIPLAAASPSAFSLFAAAHFAG